MILFFKNFGKGVLYVLVLPFLLVGMAVYGVVALFIFLFMSVKALILFFTGRSLFDDLPEDKEAKKRIARANGQEVKEEVVQPVEQGETKPNEIDTDPMYVPEYMKDQVILAEQPTETPPENIQEETIQEEESIPLEENGIPQENDEILPKNPQNDAFSVFEEDEEDDPEDDSGVDIRFE